MATAGDTASKTGSISLRKLRLSPMQLSRGSTIQKLSATDTPLPLLLRRDRIGVHLLDQVAQPRAMPPPPLRSRFKRGNRKITPGFIGLPLAPRGAVPSRFPGSPALGPFANPIGGAAGFTLTLLGDGVAVD
jgi:hypothetical protein